MGSTANKAGIVSADPSGKELHVTSQGAGRDRTGDSSGAGTGADAQGLRGRPDPLPVASRSPSGGAAFPSQAFSPQLGLSKRELIAILALQAILAHSYNDASFDGAARDAVVHADALIAELAK